MTQFLSNQEDFARLKKAESLGEISPQDLERLKELENAGQKALQGTKIDDLAEEIADSSKKSNFYLPVIQEWCFAPDTLVDTPRGKIRIDRIAEGDAVYAFDFAKGEWTTRTVMACHRSRYLGAVISIETEGGSVEATVYHPFWF